MTSEKLKYEKERKKEESDKHIASMLTIIGEKPDESVKECAEVGLTQMIDDQRELEAIKNINKSTSPNAYPHDRKTRDLLASETRYVFEKYQNKENWKMPPRPAFADTPEEAHAISLSFNYYLGGSEIKTLRSGKIMITSKGYYHYIGA
jgi:hypothetical protein